MHGHSRIPRLSGSADRRSGFQDRTGPLRQIVLDQSESSLAAARLVLHPAYIPQLGLLDQSCHYESVLCRRVAALTALIAALSLAALGAGFLAEAAVILALSNSQAAAPAGSRWLLAIAVACCLGGTFYLVGSGTCRAVRSWATLFRFAVESWTTLGVSIVVLLVGFVLVVAASALGGGFF
jgi:hypothetical protein